MADSVKEFFDGLPARVDAGRTAGVNTTYLFDIEGAGQWVVSVTDDGVQVREGPGDAACTITTTEETFLKIANGDQNPTSAPAPEARDPAGSAATRPVQAEAIVSSFRTACMAPQYLAAIAKSLDTDGHSIGNFATGGGPLRAARESNHQPIELP